MSSSLLKYSISVSFSLSSSPMIVGWTKTIHTSLLDTHAILFLCLFPVRKSRIGAQERLQDLLKVEQIKSKVTTGLLLMWIWGKGGGCRCCGGGPRNGEERSPPVVGRPHATKERVGGLVELVAEVVVIGVVPGRHAHPVSPAQRSPPPLRREGRCLPRWGVCIPCAVEGGEDEGASDRDLRRGVGWRHRLCGLERKGRERLGLRPGSSNCDILWEMMRFGPSNQRWTDKNGWAVQTEPKTAQK
jgi:hypothetical protein